MAKRKSQQDLDQQEWSDTSNWRYGLFYYCPRDSRPWVPKRSMFGRRRFGGTPNFAHPAGRGYFMLIVGVCVFLLLVVVALNSSGIFR